MLTYVPRAYSFQNIGDPSLSSRLPPGVRPLVGQRRNASVHIPQLDVVATADQPQPSAASRVEHLGTPHSAAAKGRSRAGY